MSSARIRIQTNGPLIIEGGVPLRDQEGSEIATPPGGRPYALCRCGVSARKPFCDGSHKTCDFDGTLAT
ncbi:MAG: CDGSH iron-sulfur domain-containing protein [Gammaproteobacteria bacterium]|nr:CDGSH iron-sulfur domain-containing protein [Gammaproteobacteria bacterium]